ncbi:MAG TPA: flagellar motor switch protein FliN [Acidobacteriaceae bacterium]|jgi:flagellar motor switch protein FliN
MALAEHFRRRLVTSVADALLDAAVHDFGGEWTSIPRVPDGFAPAVRFEAGLGFTAALRGTLHGQLRLEIAHKDAEALFGKRSDPSPDSLKSVWLGLMESLVLRMPKRAADAKMFPFSVESYSFAEISEPALIGEIRLEAEAEGAKAQLQLLADAELVESLRAKEKSAGKREAESALNPQLDRVIDVPLAVTLRFGQRVMRLREVLELNAGSLVELDRKVEDPVDLILDERVIAKGEVVIVDGNYGLRITEIFERNLLPSL